MSVTNKITTYNTKVQLTATVVNNKTNEYVTEGNVTFKINNSPIATSKITNGKYNNILFNDEQGLIVELPNGNYVSADRLSIGTIDQIYLSLRLASIDEISNEKLPIILDEAFAYFDDIRLENIMLFLSKEFKDRQIIIFTCTTRELRILQNNNIEFNFIEL